jgi:hypothetical protein
VQIIQDGKVVASRRLPWPAAPGRVFRVPSALLKDADPHGGAIHITLANAPMRDSANLGGSTTATTL